MRSPIFDVAKGVLIVLVVFGHLIEHLIEHHAGYRALYLTLYTFHMPAFVFAAGVFSRPALGSKQLRDIGVRLLLPLLAFQIAFVVAGLVARPLQPFWVLWFFLSLACWRLMLPIAARLNPLVAIALALIATVAAGYVHLIGRNLSLSRTLFFFPVFLLGHFYGAQIVEYVRRNRLPAAALFVAALASTVLLGIEPRSLFGSDPYLSRADAVERAAALTAGLIASATFFALLPATNRLLEWIGQRTLAIFTLHALVVLAYREIAGDVLVPLAAAPLVLAAALAVAVALAPFERLYPR